MPEIEATNNSQPQSRQRCEYSALSLQLLRNNLPEKTARRCSLKIGGRICNAFVQGTPGESRAQCFPSQAHAANNEEIVPSEMCLDIIVGQEGDAAFIILDLEQLGPEE